MATSRCGQAGVPRRFARIILQFDPLEAIQMTRRPAWRTPAACAHSAASISNLDAGSSVKGKIMRAATGGAWTLKGTEVIPRPLSPGSVGSDPSRARHRCDGCRSRRSASSRASSQSLQRTANGSARAAARDLIATFKQFRKCLFQARQNFLNLVRGLRLHLNQGKLDVV